MKAKSACSLLFLLMLVLGVTAQSGIDSVLASVSRNNKKILAADKYRETQIFNSRTANSPTNPFVEYDYLNGSPASAGKQHELLVIQAFDFPTAYGKKKSLSKENSKNANLHYAAIRQDILLEAKLVCIDLVYRKKLQGELQRRKLSAEKILQAFQMRMDKGEGGILDVNKAKLQLVGIHKENLENETQIGNLESKLLALNGGAALQFTDTGYSNPSEITTFEKLETDYELNDPIRKILLQEHVIAQKQLELSKAMRFPKLELGYRYQDFPGQQFNGIHTGISIPLWENRNQIKMRKSKLAYTDLEVQDHGIEHYYEIKRSYDYWKTQETLLKDYEDIFPDQKNIELLEIALKFGEISVIEYFLESMYFYTSYNNYLLIEREYHKTAAELVKYKL